MVKPLCTTIVLTFICLQAHAEKWVLATLEWPPYTCSHCPENGAGAKALRDAMRTQGVEVEFVFSTWTKAIEDARQNKFVGYFPAWVEGVKPDFFRSEALFQSPLGFVEQKAQPLDWKKLEDLQGKVIGVAQDYGNTAEFNKLVKEGVIKTEIVISDDTNIRKVAVGKVDGAIMDVNNALYFLNTNMADLSHKVQVSSKYIKIKTLHVALNAAHRNKLKLIKAALKKVNTQKIVRDYLQKYYPFCHTSYSSSATPMTDQ